MGYTHYWRKSTIPTTEQWEHVLNLFTVMLADPECPTVAYESDEVDRPVRADAACIWFNGVGSDGHESFAIERERVSKFDFCKTARKPYDDLVTGTLIAMRVVFGEGFSLSTDGSGREWQAGIDLYNRAASALHDQYKNDAVDTETVQAFLEETWPKDKD